MDLSCLLVGLLVGGACGAAATYAALRGRLNRLSRSGPVFGASPLEADVTLAAVFAALRRATVVVDESGAVVMASPSASALGLVRGDRVISRDLADLVSRCLPERAPRDVDLRLARGPLGSGHLAASARVAPLGEHHLMILVEDQTQARRVEAVRRDFVANVSHELKTPVGGISLLAEAILDAADEPDAVARFTRRIQDESRRLGRLVQDIVDLSKLQASEALSTPVLVDVGPVVEEAVAGVHTVAEARHITFSLAIGRGLTVYGDADMILTAVSNLLTNAVNYSGDGTRVAVVARQSDDIVEITVSDQGRGIPRVEQERIFERFYRIDPARSRATGGTGLGLAIVKHIATNHGGEVTVWSQEGKGSTFTIRLPAASSLTAVLPSSEHTPGTPAGAAPDSETDLVSAPARKDRT